MHWPAGLSAKDETRRDVCHVVDLMPTCLELAKADYPVSRAGKPLKPLDGVSLLPVLEGQTYKTRTVCWEHRGHRAVRRGRWKLVAAHGEPWQLYDMVADRTETSDVSKEHPQVVASLQEEYKAWAKRCDVVPWDELDIPFIPPNDNPLTRTEQELKAYFKALQKRQLPLPGANIPKR